ncbi:MAG: GFA family protein [Pseudomonadota bacterium]
MAVRKSNKRAETSTASDPKITDGALTSHNGQEHARKAPLNLLAKSKEERSIIMATGRCLCGAVSYEAYGNLNSVQPCHCTDCQRWSGGPFMGVEPETITINGDVTWYKSSEWAERGFCPQCGSTLFWRLQNGGHLTFAAGTLDDSSALAGIREHIFVDHQPRYYDFKDEAPRKTGTEVIAEAMANLAQDH